MYIYYITYHCRDKQKLQKVNGKCAAHKNNYTRFKQSSWGQRIHTDSTWVYI